MWLVLVAAVGAVGFTVARRAAAAGDRVSELAVVGLMAVLLSPVAWIHHFAWLTLTVAALAGDGRSRRRLVMAGVVLAWFLTRMPWWGVSWIEAGRPIAIGRLLQNSFLLGALLALALLWWVVPRRDAQANRPTV
jgi:alpha-1,2-mannosyltransferase